MLKFILLFVLLFPFSFSFGQNLNQSHNEDHAFDLAVLGLSHNILSVEHGNQGAREIVVCGAHQFRTAWSWDFAFASEGLMLLGRFDAVRDTLQSYFEEQRVDGLLPRTLDSMPIEIRVLLGLSHLYRDFKGPLKPYYVSENKVISPLPNLALTWAANRYIQHAGDLAFAKEWYESAKHALRLVEQQFHHQGLVGKQAPFSDWEDSLRRTGRVAFTNIMYLRALKAMSAWANSIGKTAESTHYGNMFQTTKQNFLQFFWDDKKGVLRNFEADPHLTADANFMAIADELVSPEQATRIFTTLEKTPLAHPLPGLPTFPPYGNRMKSFFVKIGGMKDYHDGLVWGWLTAQAAMAYAQSGRCQKAESVLQNLTKLYTHYQEISEVYEPHKKAAAEVFGLAPVKRLRYRSEYPFTWGAGMYVEAQSVFKRNCLNF